MIITIQRYHKTGNGKINKTSCPEKISVLRETARECMDTISRYREKNNLADYTPWEIIDVRD